VQTPTARLSSSKETVSLVKPNSSQIVLSPNPVSSNLVYIDGLNVTENYTITVFEMGMGRELFSQKVSHVTSCELPLYAINTSGIYLVNIRSANANDNKNIKLIKQ
jgi:outer membrane protein assembly factor BamB